MNQSTGAYPVMNPGHASAPQYRLVSNFHLSYFAGPHELKFGYQLNRIMLRSQNWSIVNYPDLPGIPFSARYTTNAQGVEQSNAVLLYNFPVDSRVFLQEHGFFVPIGQSQLEHICWRSVVWKRSKGTQAVGVYEAPFGFEVAAQFPGVHRKAGRQDISNRAFAGFNAHADYSNR